jgi:hypothetical protein
MWQSAYLEDSEPQTSVLPEKKSVSLSKHCVCVAVVFISFLPLYIPSLIYWNHR